MKGRSFMRCADQRLQIRFAENTGCRKIPGLEVVADGFRNAHRWCGNGGVLDLIDISPNKNTVHEASMK